jgi:hypothetical protein
MRVSAIAESLRLLDPEVHQLIVTSVPHTEQLRRLELPFVIVPSGDGSPFGGVDRRARTVSRKTATAFLLDVIRDYDPGLVLLDTHFPGELVRRLHKEGRQLLLVMRRCRAAYLWSLLDRGLLDLFTRILVPHERANFVFGLPAAVVGSLEAHRGLVYTGPIVRSSNATATQAALERCGVAPHSRLIVITGGSGGYGPRSTQFLEASTHAALALRADDPELVVLAVQGPNGNDVRIPSGCVFVRSESELPAVYPAAELVIAHGGYNTVHEILEAGARAVFIPVERRNESQAETIAPLVSEGRALAVSPDAPIADILVTLRLALARPRPVRRRFDGSAHAAETLLFALPEARRVAVGDDVSPPQAWRHLKREDALAECLRPRGVQSPASLLLSWRRLRSPLVREAIRVADPCTRWYVDLGSGGIDELRSRALEALGHLDSTKTTLILTDESGGAALPALVSALAGIRLCALVARVPAATLARTDGVRFQAFEACRAADPDFVVDITTLEQPLLALERP